MLIVDQNAIDFTPLLKDFWAIAEPALTTLFSLAIGYVVWRATEWVRANTKVKDEQALNLFRAAATAGLEKIAAYDMKKISDVVPKALIVDAGSPAVATAANYAIAQIPEALGKIGIDVKTAKGQEQIVRKLTAIMPKQTGEMPAQTDAPQ